MGWQKVERVPRIKNSCGQREMMGFWGPAGSTFSRADGWAHPGGACRVVSAVVKLLFSLVNSAPRVGTQDAATR